MVLNPTDLNNALGWLGLQTEEQTAENNEEISSTINNTVDSAKSFFSKAGSIADTIITVFQSIGKVFKKLIDNWQLVLIGLVAFALIRRR